jgi:hypothetical protein
MRPWRGCVFSGIRASPRLSDLVTAHESAAVRALALDALEGIDDVRVIDVAFEALRDSDIEVVIAALGVLRRWVVEETGTRLLDAITAITVDRARDARVRVAALAALSDLPDHLVRPIREQAPPPESAGPSLEDPGAGPGVDSGVRRGRHTQHAARAGHTYARTRACRIVLAAALGVAAGARPCASGACQARQSRRALRSARDVRIGHRRPPPVVPVNRRRDR